MKKSGQFTIIGLLLGIPISYWFQVERLRSKISLVEYIKEIPSFFTNYNADYSEFADNVLLSCIIFAVIFGFIGSLLEKPKQKEEVNQINDKYYSKDSRANEKIIDRPSPSPSASTTLQSQKEKISSNVVVQTNQIATIPTDAQPKSINPSNTKLVLEKTSSQIQSAYSTLSTTAQEAEIGNKLSTGLLNFNNWIFTNIKYFLTIAGSLIGISLLVMTLNFLSSLNFSIFGKSKESLSIKSTHFKITTPNSSKLKDDFLSSNGYLLKRYISGTIGNNKLGITINSIVGDKVSGLTTFGSNQRSFKGNIIDVQYASSNMNLASIDLLLRESKDEEDTGEYLLNLLVSDNNRTGQGIWKSYNGESIQRVNLSSEPTHNNEVSIIPTINKLYDSAPNYLNSIAKIKVNAKIRAEPTTNSKSIKTASRGKIVKAIDKTTEMETIEIGGISKPYSWYKITYNSQNGKNYTGWIYGGCLQFD